MVAAHGGICHICRHGGARQADHLIAIADRPDLAWDPANIRPAHGAPGNPCPVCSRDCGQRVYCNQLRGGLSIERARRIIAERAAGHAKAPGSGARPKPDPGAGRAWLVRFWWQSALTF